MNEDQIDKLLDLVKTNPDEVLNDENTLKLIVVDPELSSELVEAKNEDQLIVSIDGDDTKLKKSSGNPNVIPSGQLPVNGDNILL